MVRRKELVASEGTTLGWVLYKRFLAHSRAKSIVMRCLEDEDKGKRSLWVLDPHRLRLFKKEILAIDQEGLLWRGRR